MPSTTSNAATKEDGVIKIKVATKVDPTSKIVLNNGATNNKVGLGFKDKIINGEANGVIKEIKLVAQAPIGTIKWQPNQVKVWGTKL